MTTLMPGKDAPRFSLPTADGHIANLEDALKKGPVVAAFFKVNCPTCQFTFPFLERLYEAYGDKNVSFLGVSQNNAKDTLDFCDEFGVRFPVVIDADRFKATKQYGLTNVPTLFLISPEGKVKITSVGFVKADIEQLSAEAARASSKPLAQIFKPGEVVPANKPG